MTGFGHRATALTASCTLEAVRAGLAPPEPPWRGDRTRPAPRPGASAAATAASVSSPPMTFRSSPTLKWGPWPPSRRPGRVSSELSGRHGPWKVSPKGGPHGVASLGPIEPYGGDRLRASRSMLSTGGSKPTTLSPIEPKAKPPVRRLAAAPRVPAPTPAVPSLAVSLTHSNEVVTLPAFTAEASAGLGGPAWLRAGGGAPAFEARHRGPCRRRPKRSGATGGSTGSRSTPLRPQPAVSRPRGRPAALGADHGLGPGPRTVVARKGRC